jgi:hypothetical protein
MSQAGEEEPQDVLETRKSQVNTILLIPVFRYGLLMTNRGYTVLSLKLGENSVDHI